MITAFYYLSSGCTGTPQHSVVPVGECLPPSSVDPTATSASTAAAGSIKYNTFTQYDGFFSLMYAEYKNNNCTLVNKGVTSKQPTTRKQLTDTTTSSYFFALSGLDMFTLCMYVCMYVCVYVSAGFPKEIGYTASCDSQTGTPMNSFYSATYPSFPAGVVVS